MIKIENRTYHKTGLYEYTIPLDEIGNLRLSDIPMKDRVHFGGFKVEGVNFGFEAKHENTPDGIYNQIGFTASFRERSKKKAQIKKETLRRYLLDHIPKSWKIFDLPDFIKNEYGISFWVRDGYIKESKPLIKYFEKIIPIVEAYSNTRIKAFLCHSFKDKPIVEQLAQKLSDSGSSVWFDKWEIKSGESIVEKINAGLTRMTHLLVFLSKESVKSHWVKKELSSALMRKLSDNSVTVIPVLLEDIKIPTIIMDIKYADFRHDMQNEMNRFVQELIA